MYIITMLQASNKSDQARWWIIAAVVAATLISDSVKFLRNDLSDNITDPVTRATDERFVMTSYPQRSVRYPIITVRNEGVQEVQKTGFKSELKWVKLPMEVRVWARNEKEKDELTEQVLNRLRVNQFDGGSASSDDFELHDFKILNVVHVDEPNENGKQGVKSSVIHLSFNHMYGS